MTDLVPLESHALLDRESEFEPLVLEDFFIGRPLPAAWRFFSNDGYNFSLGLVKNLLAVHPDGSEEVETIFRVAQLDIGKTQRLGEKTLLVPGLIYSATDLVPFTHGSDWFATWIIANAEETKSEDVFYVKGLSETSDSRSVIFEADEAFAIPPLPIRGRESSLEEQKLRTNLSRLVRSDEIQCPEWLVRLSLQKLG